MRFRGYILLVYISSFLCLRPVWAVSLEKAEGALFVAADGKGRVQLFWFPPVGRWPVGGWRLEEDKTGRVLVERIVPGEAEALKALSEKDADGIRKLKDTLAKAKKTEDQEAVYGLLGARAMADPAYAQALGLSWTLSSVPSGPRSYRVVGLDSNNQPSGVTLTSIQVDASVATPLPPSPVELRIEARLGGVGVFWSPAPADRMLPVIAYHVERDGGGQTGVAVTSNPLIRGVRWDPKLPALVDANAPLEQELTYRVMSVDLFGRKSPPAHVKAFIPDLAALIPPSTVTATSEAGRVLLRWEPGNNPHTAGHIVERAYLYEGPYEVLTPAVLAPDTKSYKDVQVRGGTTYYYRIRSMGPRGDLGHPSQVATAQPTAPKPPPQVTDLKADVGRTRVRLTWEMVQFPVAGYFVERRAEGGKDWVRLNSRVTSEPLYDDHFGLQRQGGFQYRILAVGFDNQEGKPSKEVSVILPDTLPPSAPQITDINGRGGKVTLHFMPALPEGETHQFLILRGGSEDDPGVVMGDPLPGVTREFIDVHVKHGENYWYRVVAVDRADNRSEPSRAVVIRVGSPTIPTAKKPDAKFLSEPFPHVEIRFDPPPDGLAVMVQYRVDDQGPWVSLAGPIRDTTQAIDANPPTKGRVQYRVVYQAENGVQGPPSKPIEISRP